ncbi:hypothetical protein BPMI_04494c [Candidatus Burkholderia pumila]|uniref:Uncharacterized protein n=1 Tax=Candidatus Burkholderia pumila TaxID=1090375 RepID=A0ABR5HK38_9BURK|nr:hypothetical protein BPMI_04494c [Candidatus Burkholderia pumila]
MKTSTLLSVALVSVSCYAAPLHTSSTDGNAAVRAMRVNAAPVSPPAPDVAADSLDHARWRHVPLPKSRTPSRGMASQLIQVQT